MLVTMKIDVLFCVFMGGGMKKDSWAEDIRELDTLLDDAASDEELSNKAITIAGRIRRDKNHAGQKVDIAKGQILHKDDADFKYVIAEIKRRRGAQVLDKFLASDAYKKWRR